jgi:competence protein ComEC
VPDPEPESIAPAEPSAREQFARAPLVPVALAMTAGCLIDRYWDFPAEYAFLAAAVGLFAWVWFRNREQSFGWYGLLLTWAALTAAYHHNCIHFHKPDDISHAVADPPGLAKIRGFLVEEPILHRIDRSDPFIPVWKSDRGTVLIEVRQITTANGWHTISGRVKITVDRAIDPKLPFSLDDLFIGDEVEATGFLYRPAGPSNPGEWDAVLAARDRRISAEMRIGKTSDAVVRIERNQSVSINGTLAAIRARAARIIDTLLDEREAGLARALLLGDGTAMERGEWDEYMRTGVVHVLAISGQHLVVLAGFVWLLVRLFGMPRRPAAWFVIGLVVGYAAVTGLRPSAVRAAVMVAVVCLGIIRRRPLNVANALALAWILIVLLNPVDLVNTGNVLSFLSVFVLIWGATQWLASRPRSATERLIHEFRPEWQKALLYLIRVILLLYAVNAILFLANAPLIASRQNLVSPVGLLIGPPLVILTMIALIMGFLMLLVGTLHPYLAVPFAWITKCALSACGWIVSQADQIPHGVIYIPAPPHWWLIGFYAGMACLVFSESRPWRMRWLAMLFGWSLVPIVFLSLPTKSDELRVTFLSVGHGGCTVLELPDGRVIVYDAGTMIGPDAVRRSMAPYLWHRGIRRIDELFISHADLDHYNGVNEMLRRFAVGRVTLTPSFADKSTPEVAGTLAAIQREGITPRVAVAGDRFESGDVTIDVLHPPPQGPPGIENERSLVLLVSHAGHSILLTGDLEKQGTSRVITLPTSEIDVLMAPHHGSRAALSAGFQAWSKPKFVAVNRGNRAGSAIRPGDAGANVPVWDTATMGAITIRSHRSGLTAEAFRTNDRVVIRRGSQ